MNNRAEGIEGENLACEYMQKELGMHIIMRNYTDKYRKGEIDIIAEEGEVLVFCEVKARRDNRMGYALEAVTPAKIKSIVYTSAWYIRENSLYERDVRYDVCTVNLSTERVEYLPNAFTAADAGNRGHW